MRGSCLVFLAQVWASIQFFSSKNSPGDKKHRKVRNDKKKATVAYHQTNREMSTGKTPKPTTRRGLCPLVCACVDHLIISVDFFHPLRPKLVPFIHYQFFMIIDLQQYQINNLVHLELDTTVKTVIWMFLSHCCPVFWRQLSGKAASGLGRILCGVLVKRTPGKHG